MATNLIRNGNFEASIGRGAPAEWQPMNGESGQTVNDDGDNAYVFSVYQQVANAPIGQTFETVAGKSYTVSFKGGVTTGRAVNDDASVYANVFDANAADAQSGLIVSKTFNVPDNGDEPMGDYSLTFTATGSRTTLVFGGNMPSGAYAPVGIDDVSVAIDAEPENLIQAGDFSSKEDFAQHWVQTGPGWIGDGGATSAFVFTPAQTPGPDGAIEQVIDTVAGETYTLEYVAREQGYDLNKPGIGLSAYVNGAVVQQTFDLASNMTKYSVSFVATSDSTSIKFEGHLPTPDSSYGPSIGLDDVVVLKGGSTPPVNLITGTSGDDYLADTDANDIMMGGDGRDVFLLQGKGNDAVYGEGGGYNQIDLIGKSTDYTFKANTDGTVTVSSAAYGTDTLSNIDGVYFYGDSKWMPLDDLAQVENRTITGTAGNDYLVDTASNDTMEGGEGNDVFFLSKGGNDTVLGGGGDYNQVDLPGSAADYKFMQAAGQSNIGVVTVTGGGLGTNKLVGIDGVYFYGENKWYPMSDLAEMDGINPVLGTNGDDYVHGTRNNDSMWGKDGVDVFVSSLGDDAIYGNNPSHTDDGTYDQVDYSGKAADYTFTKEADGAYKVTGAATGVDTLYGIDGLWFSGDNQWYAIDDLVQPAVHDMPM